MIKFFSTVVLIGLLAWCAYLFSDVTPWFTFAIGAFIAGVSIPQKAFPAFLSGLLSVFLLWAFLNWQTDTANESVLSQKMANILPLGGSSVALMLLSALIGGITAGLAAASGALLRNKF